MPTLTFLAERFCMYPVDRSKTVHTEEALGSALLSIRVDFPAKNLGMCVCRSCLLAAFGLRVLPSFGCPGVNRFHLSAPWHARTMWSVESVPQGAMWRVWLGGSW